jgi:hypothetical protein
LRAGISELAFLRAGTFGTGILEGRHFRNIHSRGQAPFGTSTLEGRQISALVLSRAGTFGSYALEGRQILGLGLSRAGSFQYLGPSFLSGS